jgi:hypothetical protein
MYLIVYILLFLLTNKIVIMANICQMDLFSNLMIVLFYQDHEEMNLKLEVLLIPYILFDLLIIVVDEINSLD